jgi:tetratricopeptide (TPR) repeat protein
VLTNKALSFDEQLDEAYYVRGLYYASQEDGFNESMKDMNRALKINPNYVEVYKHKSVVSAWIFEDYIEAIKNGLIALKLDHSTSMPITLKRLSEFYYDVGIFEQARSYVNRAFLLDNDSSIYYVKLAWINLSEGALPEGLNAALQSYQLDTANMMSLILITMLSNSLKNEEIGYPYALKLLDMFKLYQMTTPNDFHRIGYLFWLKGKHEEAEFYMNEQQKWCEESIRLGRSWAKTYGAHHDLACVLAFKGETERAIELLSEVNDNKDFFPSWYITQFENEPFFESIEEDERYLQILTDMKAKYQKEHDRVTAWMQEEGMI